MDERLSRRRVLALAAGASAGVAGAATAGRPARANELQGQTVGLEPVVEGVTAPVGFEAPPGVDRQYVVDQVGAIVVLGPEGGRGTFLDLTDRTVSLRENFDERGVLGLAFHPDFPDDDRCFVRYSAPPREGTPDGYDHTFVLAEFRATPDRADPDSERTVLEIPEPQWNHNGGPVVFGPDGYLYLGVGDGGGGGDQGRGHVEDWYDAVTGGNGQDVTENLLGSVLRLDVDERDDGPYGIPEDNPLVGEAGLDEHYAWGLRNPWGMSFGPDGRLFVADVGQASFEEVNIVEKGGNYGWNVREGTGCFEAGGCPDETPDGEPLLDPIVEYGRDDGIAVIGGYVYRGAVEALTDSYVFGDWSSDTGAPAGSLFAATPPADGGGLWSVTELSVAGREDGDLERYVLGFGRDPEGELYVCTTERRGPTGSTGAVHRIVPDDGTAPSDGGPPSADAGGTSPRQGDDDDTDADGTGDLDLLELGDVAVLAGLALGVGAGVARLLRSGEE